MYNSQKDKRWAGEKLGTCKDTLAQSACYITSGTNLARILGTRESDPSKLNKWLTQNAGYSMGCLLVTPKMAEYLGLKYLGKVANTKVRYCIAETDHYRKVGVPQHFFVYDNATKKRIDPLDLAPEWEANTYHIVSFRVFEPLAQTMQVAEETPVPVNTTSTPVMGESNTTATVPLEPIKITVEAPEAETEVQIPIKPPEPKTEVKLGALAELIRLIAKWIKSKLERK